MQPVVVVSGPGREDLHVLLKSSVVIGRDCEGLVVNDSQVSRRHVELSLRGTKVVCTDLGSTNGTFLDGQRLVGPIGLEQGSVLRLGEIAIRIEAPPVVSPPSNLDDSLRRTSIAFDDDMDRSADVDLRMTSIDSLVVGVDAGSPSFEAETVTIMFSDIEAHTELVSRIGDRNWLTHLEAHNRIFRQLLIEYGGREIKTQGDSFMMSFHSSRAALGFAVAVQRQVSKLVLDAEGSTMRVRIGLHTGDALLDPVGDYFGLHVIKAARVASLAAGRQILASATVRDVSSGDDIAEFGAAVTVELKGLEGIHEVHEVFWDGTDALTDPDRASDN